MDRSTKKLKVFFGIRFLLVMTALVAFSCAVPGFYHRYRIYTCISKLDSNWRLKEGKRYWVGHTEEMRAVAEFSEDAIEPLLNLIKQTDSLNAKEGAVYSIHLIGVDNQPEDYRIFERFIHPSAREALLSLLNEPDVERLALNLLVRDPWSRDVPSLLQRLRNGTEFEMEYIKALQKYSVSGKPVHQDLPENIVVPRFGIDQRLSLDSKIVESLETLEQCTISHELDGLKLNIENISAYDFLDKLTGSPYPKTIHKTYDRIDRGIEYYVEDNQVFLCDISIAKERWLEWEKSNQETLRTMKNAIGSGELADRLSRWQNVTEQQK